MARIGWLIRPDNLELMDRLTRLAWAVIGWNVVTILLGSVVRATHSGAGCGRSWPTCEGQLLPALEGATAIEFTHRVASGVALVLVGVLAWAVFRTKPPAHPARRSASWAAAAVVGEALIGAAIVVYEWVGSDDSVARVMAVPLHLVNTLLLLAALTLTTWFLMGGRRLRWQGPSRRWVAVGAVALVLIFATGAITALADTLFPTSGGVSAGAEHFLTRLRIFHPILAVFAVAATTLATRNVVRAAWPLVKWLVVLTLCQLGLGLLNIALGTPLWLQILHLALADVIWIAYIWVAAQTLASDATSSATVETGAKQVKPLHK